MTAFPPLNFLLKDCFAQALSRAYPQHQDEAYLILTPATKEAFGHYQFNGALKLGKAIGEKPREVANQLTKYLPQNCSGIPLFSNISVEGPGFINMTLSQNFLAAFCGHLLLCPKLGISPPQQKEKVIVEYSSPNTAKQMHVGHLRSTIIGECLARVFEFMGYEVLRLNHIGDWGTAFGMLIAYLEDRHPQVLDGRQSPSLQDLSDWYKASKMEFDQNPSFKKKSQMRVVDLQQGTDKALKAWQLITSISRKAYQEIYDLLDVSLEERGESFYNFMLEDIVKDLEIKGLVKISNGAKCVFVEGVKGKDDEPFPLMIQKSDGGFNYDTTDVAAMKHRVQVEKAQRIIVVVDSGQSLHFKLVHETCRQAAYLNDHTRFDHVGFGLVLGSDGKKFKTRSGESVKLIDLLKEAISQAEAILKQRNPSLPEDEKIKQAKALGIGAVKYADLSCNRISDYSFSFERMLRFEGNTACYVMYAYVRALSIIEKVTSEKKGSFSIKHPSEVALAAHLARFPDTLINLSEDLLPNKLTEFLYHLADKFNAFFRDCRVEGSEELTSRLLLCQLCIKVFEQGFHLLGIPLLKKM